jgi:hypothetical protein
MGLHILSQQIFGNFETKENCLIFQHVGGGGVIVRLADVRRRKSLPAR